MNHTDFYDEQVKCFEKFCRKVILNESIDAKKHANYISQNETSLDDFSDSFNYELLKEDDCSLSGIDFMVCDYTVVVKDEDIAEALKSLHPEMRNIILLSYYCNCTDKEIAKLLNRNEANIKYGRNRALKILKERMMKQK